MDIAIQLLRYLLIAAGAYLTKQGLVDDETWTAIVGAMITILTGAWGIYVKYGTKSVPTLVVDNSHSPLTPEPPIPVTSTVTGNVIPLKRAA